MAYITITSMKPTDNSTTLITAPKTTTTSYHYSSHHPTACIKGIIYSQTLRYRQIITNNHDLFKQLQRLHTILLSRAYAHSIITAAFKAASHTKRTPPPQNTISNEWHTPLMPHVTLSVSIQLYLNTVIKHQSLK